MAVWLSVCRGLGVVCVRLSIPSYSSARVLSRNFSISSSVNIAPMIQVSALIGASFLLEA